MQDLWGYLKKVKKPIVLYGMGNGADKVIAELKQNGITISGIFCTTGFVREKLFHGFRLTDYAHMKEQFPQMVVLVCFGSNRPEVIAEIDRIASEQELYVPDVPVYGDEIFNIALAKKHADDLERVYALLADDRSKKTFENIVQFKLTGKREYLYDCAVSPEEPCQNFLNLSDYESYLDLGAYSGDTVLEFAKRVNNRYNRIFAVEPDRRSFLKLQQNTAYLERIHLFQSCIHDKQQQILFHAQGGRNSAVDSEGTRMQAQSVDSLANGHEITFIKADVEGQEEKAIIGARNTLLKFHPKMQIACYHRSDDLWVIPLQVLDIRSDYKIYLRHFPYLPAWDTNFYFIPDNKET